MLESISKTMDLEDLKKQLEKLEKKISACRITIVSKPKGLRANRFEHNIVQHY